MSQIRCIGFLSLLILSLQGLKAEEISRKCEILDGESKIPLNLKLKLGEPVVSQDVFEEVIGHKLESTATLEGKESLKFNGQSMVMEASMDWERVDYEPLKLLGVEGEGAIVKVTFYYAKEKEESNAYDLILVSIDVKTDNEEKAYAGSYGSFQGKNFLCFKE